MSKKSLPHQAKSYVIEQTTLIHDIKFTAIVYGAAHLVTATFVQWPISPDVEFSNPNPSFVPKYDGYENFFLIFGQ